MSDLADDFLEHYGVKGMQWGKRKAAKSAADDARRAKMSPSQKARDTNIQNRKSRNRKVAGAVAVGVAVAVGGAYANKMMSGKPPKLSDIPSIPKPSPKTSGKPQISSEAQKFINEFNARQNVINEKANAWLKEGYDLNQVPIPQRSLLGKWGTE